MAEDYFKNLRTVGANLDEGVAKLQEIWKMPHLLLCKNNEEDQLSAMKFIENLRNEFKCMKDGLEENKNLIAQMQESQSQFIQEATQAVESLTKDVSDMKNFFIENGFMDETALDFDGAVSTLNRQLESLSV